MREIKFRGKRIENGEWVYGYACKRISDITGKIKTIWYIIDEHLTHKEVIPETIGQYTGLKDKNGKEIYEGDIISGYVANGSSGTKRYKRIPINAEVKFENGKFTTTLLKVCDGYEERYKNGDFRWCEYSLNPNYIGTFSYDITSKLWAEGDGVTCDRIEVIGNIHEVMK